MIEPMKQKIAIGVTLALTVVLLGGLGAYVGYASKFEYRTHVVLHAPADRVWKVLNSAGAQKRWFRSADGQFKLEELTLSTGVTHQLGTLRSVHFLPLGKWQEKVVIYEAESRLETLAEGSGPFKSLRVTYQFIQSQEGQIQLSVVCQVKLRGIGTVLFKRAAVKHTLESTFDYSLLGIKALSGG